MNLLVLPASALDRLLGALRGRGFRLVGPVVRDGAIVYDDITAAADLPAGWADDQDAGRYRLRRREPGDDTLFGYAVGLATQNECPPRDPCRNHFREIPAGAGYGAIAGSMTGTVLDVVFFGYRQRLSWTAYARTLLCSNEFLYID